MIYICHPGFYYKKTSNVINSYSYITDTNTTVFTYDNSAELDNFGTDLVFGGKLFDLIDFNSSLSISHLSFTGAPGRNMNNEGTSYGGNANLTIPFGDIFSLGVNYFRWGDGVTAQGTREGKNYLSFSISKMFLDKKLRLNFGANDVLANVGKPESFTNGIGYKSTYSNNYSQQSFSINISYNFGNTEETSRQRRKKKTEPPQTQPPDTDQR